MPCSELGVFISQLIDDAFGHRLPQQRRHKGGLFDVDAESVVFLGLVIGIGGAGGFGGRVGYEVLLSRFWVQVVGDVAVAGRVEGELFDDDITEGVCGRVVKGSDQADGGEREGGFDCFEGFFLPLGLHVGWCGYVDLRAREVSLLQIPRSCCLWHSAEEAEEEKDWKKEIPC